MIQLRHFVSIVCRGNLDGFVGRQKLHKVSIFVVHATSALHRYSLRWSVDWKLCNHVSRAVGCRIQSCKWFNVCIRPSQFPYVQIVSRDACFGCCIGCCVLGLRKMCFVLHSRLEWFFCAVLLSFCVGASFCPCNVGVSRVPVVTGDGNEAKGMRPRPSLTRPGLTLARPGPKLY